MIIPVCYVRGRGCKAIIIKVIANKFYAKKEMGYV